LIDGDEDLNELNSCTRWEIS